MSEKRRRSPQGETRGSDSRGQHRSGGRPGIREDERAAYRPPGYDAAPKVSAEPAAGPGAGTAGVARYPQGVERHGRHADEPRYRRPDSEIRDEITDKLTTDPTLDASRLEITVSGGSVNLKGLVDSEDSRRRIHDLIERILGVEEVSDGALQADPHAAAAAEQRTGGTGR